MNAFDRERWVFTGDPSIPRRIESLAKFVDGICPPLALPKGVHKFRSIEEMNAFKDHYLDERIAKIQGRSRA